MFKYLLVLSLVILCSARPLLNQGNQEAVDAFDAALLELWTDGTYNQIFKEFYNNDPERFSDCVEDPASLFYPSDLTNGGLLDYMLSEKTVTLSFIQSIAVLPGFDMTSDGRVVGGFYPVLAEELLSRIAAHYSVGSIEIEWYPITDGSRTYYDHVEGLYDIIFMNLFKTAMLADPVAPRDEVWLLTCGLLTASPIRYYVCPAAVSNGIDTSSATTIDDPDTVVSVIAGGAQEAAAVKAFPNSQIVIADTVNDLYDDCENGSADIVVELPERIGAALDGIAVDSAPLGTYHNTGAAFRLDEDSCDNDDDDDKSSSSDNNSSSGSNYLIPSLIFLFIAIIL